MTTRSAVAEARHPADGHAVTKGGVTARFAFLLSACLIGLSCNVLLAADAEILRSRVPLQDLDAARSVMNPFRPSPDLLDAGRSLYHGKGFCAACHGQDGKGLGPGLELKGPLPRDFTDQAWQGARSDGELLWILKNGSPGTDMAPFIPLVLTEEEAWQVLLYIRSFGDR